MRIPIISNWIESQVKKRMEEQKILLKKFSEKARDVILEEDELLDAMAKQRVLLLKQNRKPIAIFVSEKTLEKITSKVNVPIHIEKAIREGKIPVTYVAKTIVYVNPLLKDAILFVVGSIVWKSFNNAKQEVNDDR